MELYNSSLVALEWPDFLAHYGHFCASTPAQTRALTIPLPDSQSESERLLRLTLEALAAIEVHSFGSLGTLPELTGAFQRLQKKACLSATELWSIGAFLGVAAETREFFSGKHGQERCPELAVELSSLGDYKQERAAILRAIDPDGQVKDSASPRLAKLRREERSIHDDARRETERALKQAHASGYAQDLFFDVRDGRYVIPIKREHRAQLPGIVFESSTSRATVYVEPASLRDTNDRIRQIQVEIEEEIYVILRELSDLLAPHHERFTQDFEGIVLLDLALGRALLSRDLEQYKHASPFEFHDSIELFGFFHPLLRKHLARDLVVSSNFCPEKQTRVVVISGPNTGGKTVILKALGIAALMARAGFLLPTSQTARLPFFRKVLAQIGDEQSLEKSLSSFSSSILSMREILTAADHETLVLIDEILSSTDPREAAALSKAILKDLAGRGVFCVVTTHFGDLKQLASESTAIANASMEFDPEQLKPMYRLRLGVPGRSWAIETAARLGLDPHIIAAAKANAGDEHMRLDNLLARLESQESEMQREREAIAFEKLEIEEKAKQTTAAREELRAERLRYRDQLQIEFRRREDEAMRKLETVVEDYRQRLAELPVATNLPDRTARAQGARRIVTEVRKEFERAMGEARETAVADESPASAPETRPQKSLRPGTVVRIPKKNLQGTLLTDPANVKELAEIQVGIMKIRVPWDEIYALDGPNTSAGKSAGRKRAFIPERESCPPELNLIGLRADEAEAKLGDYLDRASQSTLPSVRIVHGHGSGALKKMVREHLRTSAYRFRFRPGTQEEGGDGCTVVELTDV